MTEGRYRLFLCDVTQGGREMWTWMGDFDSEDEASRRADLADELIGFPRARRIEDRASYD